MLGFAAWWRILFAFFRLALTTRKFKRAFWLAYWSHKES